MKKTEKKSFKHPLVLIGGGVATIIIILGVLELTHVTNFYHRSSDKSKITTSQNPSAKGDPNSKIDYSPAKPSDNAANNVRKGSPSTSGQTLDQPNNSSNNGAQITVTSVTSNDPRHIGTLISGATTGTCTATLTQTGDATKVFTTTSQVVLQGNSYTCGALNFSKSSLPSSTYSAYVTLNSGGGTAKSNLLTPIVVQ